MRVRHRVDAGFTMPILLTRQRPSIGRCSGASFGQCTGLPTMLVVNPATHHTSGRAGPWSRAGSQSFSRRSKQMFRLLKRSAIPAVGVLALAAASPTFACPSSNAISNFKDDPNVGARVISVNNLSTYSFFSADENPVGGVPGLIEYCVYPIPPGNPSTATARHRSRLSCCTSMNRSSATNSTAAIRAPVSSYRVGARAPMAAVNHHSGASLLVDRGPSLLPVFG